MNWTCLVYGGPMLGVIIWWIVDARKWFKGPKVNIEHHMFKGDEQHMGSPTDKSSLGAEGIETVPE